MEYEIQLYPSGRKFLAESEETILQAALRAGVAVPYKCTNGTCGVCLSKIKVGEIGKKLPYDYTISEADKIQGKFLLCRNYPGSDMEVEVSEIMHPSDIAKQLIETRVHKIERISDEHLILELRTPRSSTLQFLAGQFVDLTIEGVDGRFHGTIASCPCNGMYLQFHFQKSQDSFVKYVFSDLQRGQAIRVTGPYGQVTFKEQHTHPVIFITQDHHFAGVKSLIEQAINLEFDQPVRLYWVMSERREHYLEKYCRVWKDHFEDYQFFPITLKKKSMEQSDIQSIVREIVNEYPMLGFDLYLSLSKTDARMIKHYLSEKGFSADQIMSISKNINC